MINIPKGTKDVLPSYSYKWQYVEGVEKEVAKLFNLKEVRTPTFEHTELFLRGVGDTTDIVNKEMYTFLDKGDRSITLKPEGTAGFVRCFIENNLANGTMPVKTFYITPVFRYERPQAGRLREHHQFGVEIFGGASADTDAEVISIANEILTRLGIKDVELNINSIGCKKCRVDYSNALKDYFAPNIDKMCPTCVERLEKNPLRVLDCKVDTCKEFTKNAPSTIDYLCDECKEHFEKLKKNLDLLGIKYKINPNIVRGLDYYSKTVFEFISNSIGSQGTILGGGRYDTLVENLGGNPTPAVGFGSGIERLLMVMENTDVPFPAEDTPTVYIAGMDETSREKAFEIVYLLRKGNVSAEFDHTARSIKAQFKYADKIGAKYVVALGSTELESGKVQVKRMVDGNVDEVALVKLVEYFKTLN